LSFSDEESVVAATARTGARANSDAVPEGERQYGASNAGIQCLPAAIRIAPFNFDESEELDSGLRRNDELSFRRFPGHGWRSCAAYS
jgi:hypothetical protein